MMHRLPPKKDVARALLLRGNVFVHLDPRRDGACVPDWLQEQPQLVLQIGLDLPLPIPDLRVDETGVFGTLSFNRNPFRCEVPWDVVFALVGDDGRGMVWPESLPQEISREVDQEVDRRKGNQIGHVDEGLASKPLALVTDEEPAPAAPPKPSKRPLPPYLRVVK